MQSSKSHYDYDSLKQQLFPIAYNIVSNIQDAEDIIQDVLVKWETLDKDNIEDPLRYLRKATANASINFTRLSKVQKELYPGTWLPEPFSESALQLVYRQVDQKSILSYSVLVLLEKLNPKERGVFILKEAFCFSHKEIGYILDIEVSSSRQLLKRAKEKLKELPTKIKNLSKAEKLINTFHNALKENSLEKLKKLLHQDVKLYSDGGGKATAATKVLFGSESVARFFIGIYKKKYHKLSSKIVNLNNEKGLIFYNETTLIACFIPLIIEEVIKDGYIILNQDKLKNLQ